MNISININVNHSEKVIKFNYILLTILGLSIILRLYHLGFQGAWIDELHTLKEADPDVSLKEFHEVNMFREGIPHLYFLIVRFFSLIFGHTLYTIRFVSLIFGVLGVFSMYLLGKEVATKNTGYIAAFLLAVHPFHIEHSQEGRSYALLMLFVILAFYRLILFLKAVNLKNALYLGLFIGLITNAQPIGIISVISIFIVIGIFFFFLKSKKERMSYIGYSFLAGIVTLLVFAPVYPKVVNASKITSFWVQKPTYDYVMLVLQQISGGNALLLYLSVLAIVVVIAAALIKSYKIGKVDKSVWFGPIAVFVWVLFYFLFVLIKSMGETSVMLSRYLTPIVPGLVLTIALAISLLKNNKLKILVTLLLSGLFLYSLTVEKQYYTTRVKSQFNDICLQIKDQNKENETVISSWGWLLSFYLDKDFTIKNVYEKNLDWYINDVKTKTVVQESFWYIDGNSRPYAVTPETEQFIQENYTIDQTIELHDAWAKHFVSKKAADQQVKPIKLAQFQNAQFDGSGNLMFFENSKSSSVPTFVSKGKYKLVISGKSMPEQKINNENAKINIYLNQKMYKSIELDEKANKEYTLDFVQEKDETVTISIEFVNDFAGSGLDRNAQISNIQLKKE
ncbi:glycosyltransferase family 39 protein [Flavobacterium suncheonense]|uniref:Glycosyltransferase RgtA/B/C/D-like domain-containing protein n=1 Tax=Flavobacterium suncheonense GH29-5 = DSM 17707 TaxID=1121899 RepID=A0A0A2ML98_9FLAO|nr:glycosyltransferase family 39 protein [Flavobacterium suncheonense]KGO89070.1 hypothetical protein Q764_09780 [Flavobacterium suncheonense GH29-5 = DSM 17707]